MLNRIEFVVLKIEKNSLSFKFVINGKKDCLFGFNSFIVVSNIFNFF